MILKMTGYPEANCWVMSNCNGIGTFMAGKTFTLHRSDWSGQWLEGPDQP